MIRVLTMLKDGDLHAPPSMAKYCVSMFRHKGKRTGSCRRDTDQSQNGKDSIHHVWVETSKEAIKEVCRPLTTDNKTSPAI